MVMGSLVFARILWISVFVFDFFHAKVSGALEALGEPKHSLIILDGLTDLLFSANGQTWKKRPVWQSVNTTTGTFSTEAFVYWHGFGDTVWNVAHAMPSSPDQEKPPRMGFIAEPMNSDCPRDGAAIFAEVNGTMIESGESYRAGEAAPYAACLPKAVSIVGTNSTDYGAMTSVVECSRTAVIGDPEATAAEIRNGTCYGYHDDAVAWGEKCEDCRSCIFGLNQIPGYGFGKRGSSVIRTGLYRSEAKCGAAAFNATAAAQGISFNLYDGSCMAFTGLKGTEPEGRAEEWVTMFAGGWFKGKLEPPRPEPRARMSGEDVGIAVLGATAGVAVLVASTGLAVFFRERYGGYDDDESVAYFGDGGGLELLDEREEHVTFDQSALDHLEDDEFSGPVPLELVEPPADAEIPMEGDAPPTGSDAPPPTAEPDDGGSGQGGRTP